MSIAERMEKHQEDIANESMHVQELMMQSTTGQALMQASGEMAMSDEMQQLMASIDHPNATDEDKFLMGKYMGQLLQEDPENGLINYSDYLTEIANDPNYADRKDYFDSIAVAALALNKASAFVNYVKKYKEFEQDASEEATATRTAMQQMSEKMRDWMEGESSAQ